VALVSHLPYLLAATLIQQATQAADGAPTLWQVSASGFRDTSRLAGSSPAMMRDILLTNRPAIIRALDRFVRQMGQVRRLIDAADPDELMVWLSDKQNEYLAYRAGIAAQDAQESASGSNSG
jgi:prephenate dehydrogenase